MMVEMELVGIRVELPSNTPIVLLRERTGDRRLLPIFIGSPEATAIAFALEGVETPRPLTHDLLKQVLDDLKVRLEQVVVTELRETTFYAELHLTGFGETYRVSSRPSDAVALAVRAKCPIFAHPDVLDEAGYIDETIDQQDGEGSGTDPDEVVEEFRHFIDNVNPDDFAS